MARVAAGRSGRCGAFFAHVHANRSKGYTLSSQAPPIEAAAHLVFGQGGNAAASQLDGFSKPENGYVWAFGPRAVLRVKLRPGQGDLMLELNLLPFTALPDVPRQRIGVVVNGAALGTEWAQGETVLGFCIPAQLVAGRSDIELILSLPDARASGSEAGGRPLGCQLREALLVWIPREERPSPRRLPPLAIGDADPPERVAELVRFCTGTTMKEILGHFESLGHNSEFGRVQRACGAEAAGLLSFADISTRYLLQGLDFGFENVDEPGLMHAYPGAGADPDWILQHDRYDMHVHSTVRVAGTDKAAFVVQQAKRLGQQRARLLEHLETGNKLFVFQRREPLTAAHVLPILTLLRSYGPSSLLFVTTESGGPSGSVDLVAPHLFRGNIDRLAPADDPAGFHLPAWMSICANAYRMWRVTGHGG